jgi:hypothetical protein
MIFYLIPATTDRPAQLAPKGDDAKAEAKARGLKLKPADMLHDVPTDKAGLQAYINAMLVTQHNMNLDLEAATEAPLQTVEYQPINMASVASEVARRREALATTFEATDIEEFILSRASIAQACNIFQCLGTRFAELVKGARS